MIQKIIPFLKKIIPNLAKKKKQSFSNQLKSTNQTDNEVKSDSTDNDVSEDVNQNKSNSNSQTDEKAKKDTEKIKKRVNYSFIALFKNLIDLFRDIVDIRADSNVEKTNEAILDDIEFRGANVWALIASIIIASIGLNINSTAVVIGAMLISPLMGPIIGVGWSIAVNDIDSLNKSIKNYLVMVFLGVATSGIYFYLSPLSAPSAEMIGRTSPTILDLFIAFFGGVAGIVSMSKSGKVNVILGVAIATALIPPLCTAGYGIAEGNMEFFVGAAFLFLINSVFIGLASFIMIRYLKFPLKTYLDPKKDKRVKQILMFFGLLVMIPSAYTFYNSIILFKFESEAKRFVDTEIRSHKSSKVLKSETIKGDSVNTIELFMIGEVVDSITLSEWDKKLINYGLENTVLQIYQDADVVSNSIVNPVEFEQMVRSGIVEDIYKRSHEELKTKEQKIKYLENVIANYEQQPLQILDISQEAKVIVSEVEDVALGINFAINDSGKVDTIYSMMVNWKATPTLGKKKKNLAKDKLQQWLSVRLKKDSVIILETN